MKVYKLKSTIPFLIFFLLFFLCNSCNKREGEIIESELTFESISFKSAYGASQEEYNSLLKEIDQVIKKNENTEKTKLYKYFDRLNQCDLLKNPNILLLINKDSVLTVYLAESEYNKIKDIKHSDLLKDGKKMIVKLELFRKDKDIYYSNNILSMSKVNGRSRSNQ